MVGKATPGSHSSGQALDVGGVRLSELNKALAQLLSEPRFSGYKIIGPKLEADHYHIGIIPSGGSAAIS